MTLREFKDYIAEFPKNTNFDYSLSEPFSWRGSYDEVCFTIIDAPSTREEVLKEIEKAYTKTFYGYKGGAYTYGDWTDVHFEEHHSDYSDGDYAKLKIAEIRGGQPYKSVEDELITLAFNNEHKDSHI